MAVSLAPFLPPDDGLFAPRLDELDRCDDSDNDEPADLTETFDIVAHAGAGTWLTSLFRRSRVAAGRDSICFAAS